MKQGSFELPPLDGPARKTPWRRIVIVAVACLASALIVYLLVSWLGSSHSSEPHALCASQPARMGQSAPGLQPKSTNPADYPAEPNVAPARVCTPAEVFPSGGGPGLVFQDAIYQHCGIQPAGPDVLCKLTYATGPNFLPEQPANPTLNIEGRDYGNCRFDSAATVQRIPDAGRDDLVADILRCTLVK